MIDARCDHPNAEPVYSIYQFQRLTALEIEKYRHRLFYLDCGTEAFYRRKSISGNAACFVWLSEIDLLMVCPFKHEISPLSLSITTSRLADIGI